MQILSAVFKMKERLFAHKGSIYMEIVLILGDINDRRLLRVSGKIYFPFNVSLQKNICLIPSKRTHVCEKEVRRNGR